MGNKWLALFGIALFFLGTVASVWGQEKIQLGLDRLIQEFPEKIAGKRIGVIGNHTSVNANGDSIVSILGSKATVVSLFGPEHGFQGNQSAGDDVGKSILQGIPVYSLYGDYRAPTAKMLHGVDLLIYDMQDVGVRFYTYISSLFLALTAAQRQGIPILVLDRPNPVTALRIEGPVLNPAYASFVGVMPLPIRYGMTIGELAQLMNNEAYAGFSVQADLTVIPMKNYRREMWYDETGIPWIAPSPNMPTLETAILYPGLCLFEGANITEGRGTDTPFQTIGAPFLDAQKWLKDIPLDVRRGVEIKPVRFTPKSIPGKAEDPKFKDQSCNGLQLKVTNREELKPVDLAVALLCSAQSLYPKQLKLTQTIDRLWGDETLRSMISEGNRYPDILAAAQRRTESFQSIRKKYLWYPE